jgi:hypothetical protein
MGCGEPSCIAREAHARDAWIGSRGRRRRTGRTCLRARGPGLPPWAGDVDKFVDKHAKLASPRARIGTDRRRGKVMVRKILIRFNRLSS